MFSYIHVTHYTIKTYVRGQDYSNMIIVSCCCCCLKKNQTTPRPSEHPPVIMGKKMSKRSGGIKRLQIQNHFMAFKQVPRCR